MARCRTEARCGVYGTVRCFISLVIALTAVGCQRDTTYPSRPVTIVCPWGAGGGTDRVSRQIAIHLEQELGQPVSVINATGGKGVTGHSRGMQASPDGYTVAMVTLELSMMHWSGLTELDYEDCDPLISVNEDYAALFVRKEAPWASLVELEAAVRDAPHTLKASGTATGGAWHLALAGWLLEMGVDADAVTWISSTDAATSLQELVSGGVDMVCCSLPEARDRLNSGEIVALGVMAPQRVRGFDRVPTFVEQGTNWDLCGWRALAVPLGTPPAIRQRLLEALLRIVRGETEVANTTFPQFMQQMGFDNTSRTGDELETFLRVTDAKFGKLLTSEAMQTVNAEPFDRYLFPNLLMGGIIIVLGAMGLQRFVRGATTRDHVADVTESVAPGVAGYLRMFLVVLAILVFVGLAPHVGFLAAMMPAMIVLFLILDVPKWQVAVLGLVLPLAVYFAFAHGLHVPLPWGWFEF